MPYAIWPRWACFPLAALTLSVLCIEGRAQSPELGKQVFVEIAQPPCAVCHALAAAGATGEVGPSLDELKPDEEKVRLAVQRGVGNMPPYGEILSEEQIDAVSKFVAKAVR